MFIANSIDDDESQISQSIFDSKNIHLIKSKLDHLTSINYQVYQFLSQLNKPTDQAVNISNKINTLHYLLQNGMKLRIPVLGVISAGKSTFINSIIGMNILDTGPNVTTKIICVIQHHDDAQPSLFKAKLIPTENNFNKSEPIWNFEEDTSINSVTGKENIRNKIKELNAKIKNDKNDIHLTDVFYILKSKIKLFENLSSEIKNRIELIDFPGLNDIHSFFLDNALHPIINSSSCFIFLMHYSYFEVEENVKIMLTLKKEIVKRKQMSVFTLDSCIFLLNCIDQKNYRDVIDEKVRKAKSCLTKIFISDDNINDQICVIPVSLLNYQKYLQIMSNDFMCFYDYYLDEIKTKNIPMTLFQYLYEFLTLIAEDEVVDTGTVIPEPEFNRIKNHAQGMLTDEEILLLMKLHKKIFSANNKFNENFNNICPLYEESNFESLSNNLLSLFKNTHHKLLQHFAFVSNEIFSLLGITFHDISTRLENTKANLSQQKEENDILIKKFSSLTYNFFEPKITKLEELTIEFDTFLLFLETISDSVSHEEFDNKAKEFVCSLNLKYKDICDEIATSYTAFEKNLQELIKCADEALLSYNNNNNNNSAPQVKAKLFEINDVLCYSIAYIAGPGVILQGGLLCLSFGPPGWIIAGCCAVAELTYIGIVSLIHYFNYNSTVLKNMQQIKKEFEADVKIQVQHLKSSRGMIEDYIRTSIKNRLDMFTEEFILDTEDTKRYYLLNEEYNNICAIFK